MPSLPPWLPRTILFSSGLLKPRSCATQIRQLIDQEAATQLEINTITNRVYAPVTSVSPNATAPMRNSRLPKTSCRRIRDQIIKET